MRVLPGSKSAEGEAMMTGMVMGESDVVGMLAYAIHEQFRDDWRREFRTAFGRDPDTHEQKVFDVGESTARRMMTYRFLVDARVIGTYGESHGRATDRFVQKVYAAGARGEVGRQSAWGRLRLRRVAFGLVLAVTASGTVSVATGLGPRAVTLAMLGAFQTP